MTAATETKSDNRRGKYRDEGVLGGITGVDTIESAIISHYILFRLLTLATFVKLGLDFVRYFVSGLFKIW